MKNPILLLFAILLSCSTLLANPKTPVETIDTEFTYQSNDRNESQAQAEKIAIERAKQRALEIRFGVSMNATTMVTESEKEDNGTYSTSSDLYINTESIPLGIWIRTLDEKILSSTHNGEFWTVSVYVKGEARARTKDPVQIQTAFINNTHDRDERADYYDHDDLFLRFLSPVDGALCVYLIDEKYMANCLLPYADNTTGYQAVEGNKEYLFFSATEDRNAQEITLGTQEPLIYNTLYVIFSPNTFTKAADKKQKNNWRNEPTPRYLPQNDFFDWLSRNQVIDEEMVVKHTTISIRQRR